MQSVGGVAAGLRPAGAQGGCLAAGCRRPAPSQQPAAFRAAHRRRLAPAVSAAAGNPNFSPEDARKQLNRMASDARQKLEEFARQQRLKERLDGGLRAASQAAKQAADEAGKTAKKVRCRRGACCGAAGIAS